MLKSYFGISMTSNCTPSGPSKKHPPASAYLRLLQYAGAASLQLRNHVVQVICVYGDVFNAVDFVPGFDHR